MNKFVLAAAMVAAGILAACGRPPRRAHRRCRLARRARARVADADHPAVAVSGTDRDPAPYPGPYRQADPDADAGRSFSRAEQYLIDGIMRGESDCSPSAATDYPDWPSPASTAPSSARRSPGWASTCSRTTTTCSMPTWPACQSRTSSWTAARVPGEGEGAYIPAGEEFSPDRHALRERPGVRQLRDAHRRPCLHGPPRSHRRTCAASRTGRGSVTRTCQVARRSGSITSTTRSPGTQAVTASGSALALIRLRRRGQEARHIVGKSLVGRGGVARAVVDDEASVADTVGRPAQETEAVHVVLASRDDERRGGDVVQTARDVERVLRPRERDHVGRILGSAGHPGAT